MNMFNDLNKQEIKLLVFVIMFAGMKGLDVFLWKVKYKQACNELDDHLTEEDMRQVLKRSGMCDNMVEQSMIKIMNESVEESSRIIGLFNTLLLS